MLSNSRPVNASEEDKKGKGKRKADLEKVKSFRHDGTAAIIRAILHIINRRVRFVIGAGEKGHG